MMRNSEVWRQCARKRNRGIIRSTGPIYVANGTFSVELGGTGLVVCIAALSKSAIPIGRLDFNKVEQYKFLNARSSTAWRINLSNSFIVRRHAICQVAQLTEPSRCYE